MKGPGAVCTSEGIISLQPDGSASIVLKHPLPCACGRVAAFIVHRDGKTRCLVCDEVYSESRGGSASGTP